MYVINTTRGDRVCREPLACTQAELPRELARKAGVKPIEIVYYHAVPMDQRHMTDMELLSIYGSSPTFRSRRHTDEGVYETTDGLPPADEAEVRNAAYQPTDGTNGEDNRPSAFDVSERQAWEENPANPANSGAEGQR